MINLQKNTLRLIFYTLVIGGSFYLGTMLYPSYTARNAGEILFISLKEFHPELEKRIQEDLKITAGEKTMTIKNRAPETLLGKEYST